MMFDDYKIDMARKPHSGLILWWGCVVIRFFHIWKYSNYASRVLYQLTLYYIFNSGLSWWNATILCFNLGWVLLLVHSSSVTCWSLVGPATVTERSPTLLRLSVSKLSSDRGSGRCPKTKKERVSGVTLGMCPSRKRQSTIFPIRF